MKKDNKTKEKLDLQIKSLKLLVEKLTEAQEDAYQMVLRNLIDENYEKVYKLKSDELQLEECFWDFIFNHTDDDFQHYLKRFKQ